MRPITSSSDFAPLQRNMYDVYTEQAENDQHHDPNVILRLEGGYCDRDISGSAEDLPSFNEQLFPMHVLPDRTFTNQEKILVLEGGKLQQIPSALQLSLCRFSEGVRAMIVEKPDMDAVQRRIFLLYVEKRISLSGDLYSLYYLSLDYGTVVRLLQSSDCSSDLAVDTRPVDNSTLLVASDFLIPILEAVSAGASVLKEFEGKLEPRTFFDVAVKAIRDGPPLVRTCYRQGIRAFGLAIQMELVLPSALDPGTVGSEYRTSQ